MKKLVQGYGTVAKVWRGCASSPLVHKQLILPVSKPNGFTGYKDVESEEDMLRFIRSVSTAVPGLSDLSTPYSKSRHVNNECLRVISTPSRFHKKLELIGSKLITNWSPIEPLVSVDQLRLINTNIDDDGLASVGRLKNLQTLELTSNKRIADKGLSRLSSLAKLWELWLSGTTLSDAGLKFLKPFVCLEVLCLGSTITRKGLSILAASHGVASSRLKEKWSFLC